ENFTSVSQSASSSIETSPNYVRPGGRLTIPKEQERNALPACTIAPMLPRVNDFHLPGSSSSAFRPFITQTSLASTREISSSSQNQNMITSTPISRRAERSTLPGTSSFMSFQRTTPSPSPQRQLLLSDANNGNDENEDGRTTASAPPCTPAPEPHLQPQSPFRNNRQIKKIDLLAMSRSRQSDRAENARRDGRLAPSPRKKDEVLRNSGFTFASNRGYEAQSTLRLSMQNSRLTGADTGVSPERLGNGASPNIDVVSVDDQPDPSKCMFSIQFHDFAPAEQVMKCNICGFVTNNQRFYRRHRRLHTRQYQPNLIHCNLCEYSTTQIRKMREHTITNHHMSHPHSLANSNQAFNPSVLPESTHRPHVQSQMFMGGGSGSLFHPVSNRPVNVAVGAASTTGISNASSLGLPTYIPTAQEPHLHVNTQATLQHPPRGSAMLGNYAPTNDQQVTSYMRSVISNLMSPRTDPNNSVSSSSLYLQAARNFPQESHTTLPSNNVPIMEETYNYRRFWNANSSNSTHGDNHNITGSTFVKVKTEPRAAPISQLSRGVHDMPSSTQKDRPVRSPRRQSDTLDSESGMDMSSDDHASSPQPGGLGCRSEARISTETHQTSSTAQADDPSIASQCPVPFIKIEFPPHRDTCNYLNRNSCTRTDREVQCEIISMSSNHHRQGGRTQSEAVSSAGGSAVVETRCYFCGVTFDDEVLYSIHIGCHSHTDPFMCNVCGKQCHNKYGFYSHIMRGHQSRPNT
ncbi:unnamed protein product, partial [Lymnaea stagnalis]